MTNYLWLLDPGHGAIDADGNYTTKKADPPKMFDHGDFIAYEGVSNRGICAILTKLMDEAGMLYDVIPDNIQDTPLRTRTDIANSHAKTSGKQCIYISIHSNRMPKVSAGRARGIEIFIYKPKTAEHINPNSNAAKVAGEMFDLFASKEKWRMRRGDKYAVKGGNYHVCRETSMPAVLLELLFFDRLNEALILNSSKGQAELAECIFEAMVKIESEQLI